MCRRRAEAPLSISGLIIRQIHAIDATIVELASGGTKLCVNADLSPGFPPPR